MNKSLLLEKIPSAIFTAVALFSLSDLQVRELFIVIGLGHIFISFLYSYRVRRKEFPFHQLFGVGALLFISYDIFRYDPYLEIVTSLYFVVHFLLDERHLNNKPSSWSGMLEILPFFLLYSAYILDGWFHLGFAPWALVLAVIFSVLGVAYGAGRYFLIGSLLLTLAYPWRDQIRPNHLLGAIILFHYTNWYLHYLIRYRNDARKLRSYLKDVALINLVVVLLYWGYLEHAAFGGALHYFFSPSYFYIWTLLHLIFTTRRKDWVFLTRGYKSL